MHLMISFMYNAYSNNVLLSTRLVTTKVKKKQQQQQQLHFDRALQP